MRGVALSSITRPEVSHKAALPLTPPLQWRWGWSQPLLLHSCVWWGEQSPEPHSRSEELPEMNPGWQRQRGRWRPEIKPQLMVFPRAGGCWVPRGSSPWTWQRYPSPATLRGSASGASLFGDIWGQRSERCLCLGVRERDSAGARGCAHPGWDTAGSRVGV